METVAVSAVVLYLHVAHPEKELRSIDGNKRELDNVNLCYHQGCVMINLAYCTTKALEAKTKDMQTFTVQSTETFYLVDILISRDLSSAKRGTRTKVPRHVYEAQ